MLTRRFLMQTALAAVAGPDGDQAKQAFELFRTQGLYLPLSERHRLAAASEPGELDSYSQSLAMNGDVTGAWRATRAAFPPARSDPAPDLSTVHATDAVEAVVDALKGRRVVAINDDHSTSLTRAFAHRLALRLGREGFDVLAAETFSDRPEALRELNSPQAAVTTRLGYYTGDPVYAEMARDLREQGWMLSAYEQRADQTPKGLAGLAAASAREEAQALNLAHLIRSRPDRKVLIFCGEGHAAKRSPMRLMGERLVGMGVDFVSATQIMGLPAPSPADDDPLMSAALARFRPTRPVALRHADGRPYETVRSPGAYDVFIVHPRLPPIDGRPGWLAAAPGRRPASAPLPPGLPAGALVQAAPRDEAARAVNVVPSDQYPLPQAGVRRAAFFLRPGAYLVRVETLEGRREVGRLDVPGASA